VKSLLPNQVRIPELDGIRGLAISMVLFQHYVADSIIPGTNRVADFIKNTLTLGGTGVDLFFVLSGFLIGGILIDNRKAENYFKAFYVRRICRILPVYFLCLASYAAFGSWLNACSSQQWFTDLFESGVSLWSYATFTQNIFETIFYGTAQIWPMWLGITWSLALEEQFYLLLPLAIWFVRPAWLLPALFSCICIHPLLYLCLWMYHPLAYFSVSLLLPVRADALLIGVICAYLLRQNRSRNWLEENRNYLYVLLVFLSLGAGYIAINFNSGNFEFERCLFAYSWLALFYACLLVLAVTEKNGVISRLMRFTPLRKLGIIAYGTYLFHQAINGLLHGLILGGDYHLKNFSDCVVTLIALFATIFFTTVSWRVFEKPIIALGHSFLYNRNDVKPMKNLNDIAKI
jgi:peptidoglycan/LPS O-acetylase OafA/YrhL